MLQPVSALEPYEHLFALFVVSIAPLLRGFCPTYWSYVAFSILRCRRQGAHKLAGSSSQAPQVQCARVPDHRYLRQWFLVCTGPMTAICSGNVEIESVR